MPHGAPRPLALRSVLRDVALPSALALALRVALIALAPTGPSWDGVIYTRAAEQLARGEGYTLRILSEQNRPIPTAFYPVGYPALLALVRLAGGALLADRLLQALATSALVPLAYLYARRAHSRPAGRAAAWLAALWPGGVFLSATWLAEPMFALGLGLALLPLLYARRQRRLPTLALSALGLGAIAYVRASSLPIAACLGLSLGAFWLRESHPARRVFGALALGALVTALACVPLAPWAVRNARALGTPILVSSNDGVNLLLGAIGDGSFTPVPADDPCKRAGLREVARDRCFRARALEAIAADPLAWVGRAMVKLAHTYGHDSAPAQCFSDGLHASPAARNSWRLWSLGLCRLGWLALFSAALAGARSVVRAARPSACTLLLAPVVAIALLHSTFLGGDRYHAAVAPMLIALAGIGLANHRRMRGMFAGRAEPADASAAAAPPTPVQEHMPAAKSSP